MIRYIKSGRFLDYLHIGIVNMTFIITNIGSLCGRHHYPEDLIQRLIQAINVKIVKLVKLTRIGFI